MASRLNLKTQPDAQRARKNAQNRAYYARNRARVLSAHAAWRAQNPGYDAQFMRDKRAETKRTSDGQIIYTNTR